MGRNGTINGNVNAKKIIIQGSVQGSIEAERVEIHAKGKMTGSLTSTELVIEAQAVFEGDSHFKSRDAIEKALEKSVVKPLVSATASSEKTSA